MRVAISASAPEPLRDRPCLDHRAVVGEMGPSVDPGASIVHAWDASFQALMLLKTGWLMRVPEFTVAPP